MVFFSSSILMSPILGMSLHGAISYCTYQMYSELRREWGLEATPTSLVMLDGWRYPDKRPAWAKGSKVWVEKFKCVVDPPTDEGTKISNSGDGGTRRITGTPEPARSS